MVASPQYNLVYTTDMNDWQFYAFYRINMCLASHIMNTYLTNTQVKHNTTKYVGQRHDKLSLTHNEICLEYKV